MEEVGFGINLNFDAFDLRDGNLGLGWPEKCGGAANRRLSVRKGRFFGVAACAAKPHSRAKKRKVPLMDCPRCLIHPVIPWLSQVPPRDRLMEPPETFHQRVVFRNIRVKE